MNFTEWISSTGATAALLAILFFIFRNWILTRLTYSIKHEYEKDLEQHKANLKRDYDVQIETLKADFAKNQFRFSHIFEKTADTIVKTYQMLVEMKEDAHINIALYGRTDEPALKHRQQLDAKRIEFYQYQLKNKIYLPRTTAQLISQFTAKLNEIQVNYDTSLRVRSPKSNETLENAIQSLFNEVPKLLSALEDDFQKNLGFPIQNKSPQGE